MKAYKGIPDYYVSYYPQNNSYTFNLTSNLVGYNLYRIKLENNINNDLTVPFGKIVGAL